jgi:hypothetical protein
MSSFLDGGANERFERSSGSEEPTVPIMVNQQELDLLQQHVRHEIEGEAQGQWKWPPASLTLNDKIAEAMLFQAETGEPEVALQLTRHDCLIIDFRIQVGAEIDADGNDIGRALLLKTYAARRTLRDGDGGVDRTDRDCSYKHAIKADVPWREES